MNRALEERFTSLYVEQRTILTMCLLLVIDLFDNGCKARGLSDQVYTHIKPSET